MMTNPEREGAERRDTGMERAIQKAEKFQPSAVRRAEMAFLKPGLMPRGTCCTDSIPEELSKAYPDGGKWVGSVVNGFLCRGWIKLIRHVRSNRPSRHRGKVGLYRITRKPAVIEHLEKIEKALEQKEKMNHG